METIHCCQSLWDVQDVKTIPGHPSCTGTAVLVSIYTLGFPSGTPGHHRHLDTHNLCCQDVLGMSETLGHLQLSYFVRLLGAKLD